MRVEPIHDDEHEYRVAMSRLEMQVLIGGMYEALFELGDNEFHVRVGQPARVAHGLVAELSTARKQLKRQDLHSGNEGEVGPPGGAP